MTRRKGTSAGMVVNEGVGGNVGTGCSLSRVLRRDRGRCSPVERMKGSLENSPAALEELRLRAGKGDGASELARASGGD
jgi:hypothetical protein